MQETPGLHLPGAQAAIVAHVKAQLRQWFQTDQDPDRKTPLDGMSDPRIDACLYFILPGALRPQDISFMQALSTVVPVIPILAKVLTQHNFPPTAVTALQKESSAGSGHL